MGKTKAFPTNVRRPNKKDAFGDKHDTQKTIIIIFIIIIFYYLFEQNRAELSEIVRAKTSQQYVEDNITCQAGTVISWNFLHNKTPRTLLLLR